MAIKKKIMLVVFEGLDGSGKSTIVKTVFDQLISEPEKYAHPIITKEPGSNHTDLGIQLRELVLINKNLTPLERELLFYVDASQHKRFIEKKTKEHIILSDRGKWSHLAYLRGYLKTGQIDFDLYSLLKKVVSASCALPDLVVYLDAPKDIRKQRMVGRNLDVIEANGSDYFKHVGDTYKDLIKLHERFSMAALGQMPYYTQVLDATKSVDSITWDVLQCLGRLFNEKELKSGNRDLSR